MSGLVRPMSGWRTGLWQRSGVLHLMFLHLWGARCCLFPAPVPFVYIKAWSLRPLLPLCNRGSVGSCHIGGIPITWAPAGCSSDTAACTLGQATFAGMSQLASEEQPPPCFFTHPSLQGVSLTGSGWVQGRASPTKIESLKCRPLEVLQLQVHMGPP